MWHVVEVKEALDKRQVIVDGICIKFCTQSSKQANVSSMIQRIKAEHRQQQVSLVASQHQTADTQVKKLFATGSLDKVDKHLKKSVATGSSDKVIEQVLPSLSAHHSGAQALPLSSPTTREQVVLEARPRAANIPNDETQVGDNYIHFEPVGSEPIFTVEVSGFPSFCTKETVKMFLCNKRKSGRGNLEIYTYNGDERTAIATFCKPEGM